LFSKTPACRVLALRLTKQISIGSMPTTGAHAHRSSRVRLS
jgi:hypothetical protein